MKNTVSKMVLSLVVLLAIGCGGSNTAQLCDALSSQIFEVCDANDPGDVSTLQSLAAALGSSLSSDEIESASESSLSSECKTEFEGDEDVSDEATQVALSAINGASSCQALAGVVGNLLQ